MGGAFLKHGAMARSSIARVLPALLVLAAASHACAKKSAELPTAQAAGSAPGANKGEGSADDKTPPAGVDLTALDEFERKVFFRVINKESSVCGKAQS